MRNLYLLPSIAFAACAGVAYADAPVPTKDANRPDADGWYSLFNGKDFTGWKKSEDNPDTFKVVDGEIVVERAAMPSLLRRPCE